MHRATVRSGRGSVVFARRVRPGLAIAGGLVGWLVLAAGCAQQATITGEPAVYGVDRQSGRVVDRDIVPGYAEGARKPRMTPEVPLAAGVAGETPAAPPAEASAVDEPQHIIPGKGDVVTITLDTVFLKRARVMSSPHVLVYAEVYPDGSDDPKKAYTRVLFEQRNQPANVFLGMADRVLYGPAVYQGFPIRVKLYVIDLVREEKERGSLVLDKLGGFAKYAPVQASLPITLALDIAKMLNALQEDDYELRFDLTLHSQDAAGVFSLGSERDAAMKDELARVGKPFTLNTGLRTGSYFINKRELSDRAGTTPFQSISYDWANPNQEAVYEGTDGNQYLVEGFFSVQGGRNYFVADHAYRLVPTPPTALAASELATAQIDLRQADAAIQNATTTLKAASAKAQTVPAEIDDALAKQKAAIQESEAALGRIEYWTQALERARRRDGGGERAPKVKSDAGAAPAAGADRAPIVSASMLSPAEGAEPDVTDPKSIRRPLPYEPKNPSGPGWTLEPDLHADMLGRPDSSLVIRFTEKDSPNFNQLQTLRRGTRIEMRDQTYALLSVEVGARGGVSLSTDALRADSDLAVARIRDLLDSTGASGQELNKSLDAVASTAATIFEQRRLALEIGSRVANDNTIRGKPEYILLWTSAMETLGAGVDTTAYRNKAAKNAAIIAVLGGNIVNFPVVPSDDPKVIEVLRNLSASDLATVPDRPGRFSLKDGALRNLREAMGLKID